MIELLGSGVLGSLLGGLFRLAPEFLKWLDKRNERQHELQMFDRQCQLEAQKGAQKLQEIGAANAAAVDSGVLDAFKLSIAQQTDMVKAAAGWAASLSASVRPVVTYMVFVLWAVLHVFLSWTAYKQGMPAEAAARMLLSPDFVALVAGTINYWFLDRTLVKRGMA